MNSQDIQDYISIRTVENDDDIKFIKSTIHTCIHNNRHYMYRATLHEDTKAHIDKSMAIALKGIPGKMNNSIFLACSSEESSTIYAFIIADPILNHIYFNYTKYAFRELGIQKNFLLPLVIDPTRRVTNNYATDKSCKYAKQYQVQVIDKVVEFCLEREILGEDIDTKNNETSGIDTNTANAV